MRHLLSTRLSSQHVTPSARYVSTPFSEGSRDNRSLRQHSFIESNSLFVIIILHIHCSSNFSYEWKSCKTLRICSTRERILQYYWREWEWPQWWDQWYSTDWKCKTLHSRVSRQRTTWNHSYWGDWGWQGRPSQQRRGIISRRQQQRRTAWYQRGMYRTDGQHCWGIQIQRNHETQSALEHYINPRP